MSDKELTKPFRNELSLLGITYTKGYVAGGNRVNEDNVTTIWPKNDTESGPITFVEEDGVLACIDGLTVEQAVAAARMV